jgi:hypothetical protein
LLPEVVPYWLLQLGLLVFHRPHLGCPLGHDRGGEVLGTAGRVDRDPAPREITAFA